MSFVASSKVHFLSLWFIGFLTSYTIGLLSKIKRVLENNSSLLRPLILFNNLETHEIILFSIVRR